MSESVCLCFHFVVVFLSAFSSFPLPRFQFKRKFRSFFLTFCVVCGWFTTKNTSLRVTVIYVLFYDIRRFVRAFCVARLPPLLYCHCCAFELCSLRIFIEFGLVVFVFFLGSYITKSKSVDYILL